MTTRWIDPTLPHMDQPELDLAWNEYVMRMFLESETDSENESESEEEDESTDDGEEFGDDIWEEGPQTPPFGPQAPRRQLVPVGGGLAVSVETDSEDEEWLSDSSSMTAP